MKILISIISLVFSFHALAQSEAELQLMRQKLEADAQRIEEEEAKHRENYAKTVEKESKILEQKNYLIELQANRGKVERELRQEISDALGRMTLAERMVSRKAGYYRCVRDTLDTSKVIDTQRCYTYHPADLTPEEKAMTATWKKKLPLNQLDSKYKIEGGIL